MIVDKEDHQTINFPITSAANGGSADMTPDAITSFIQGHAWKFAKTMPRSPHWYIAKEKCRSAAEFEGMVLHICKFGFKEMYQGWHYTVFVWQTPDQDEPWKYWTMGYPLDQTIIINRTYVNSGKRR